MGSFNLLVAVMVILALAIIPTTATQFAKTRGHLDLSKACECTTEAEIQTRYLRGEASSRRRLCEVCRPCTYGPDEDESGDEVYLKYCTDPKCKSLNTACDGYEFCACNPKPKGFTAKKRKVRKAFSRVGDKHNFF